MELKLNAVQLSILRIILQDVPPDGVILRATPLSAWAYAPVQVCNLAGEQLAVIQPDGALTHVVKEKLAGFLGSSE